MITFDNYYSNFKNFFVIIFLNTCQFLFQAVLLYQCVQNLDAHSLEGLTDFINELKNAIDSKPARKGVKAQKVSLICHLNCLEEIAF